MGIAVIDKHKKIFFVILVLLMCMFFSGYNRNFQADSETLVIGPLRGSQEYLPKGRYPLGRYIGIDGEMKNYNLGITSRTWKDGYSAQEAAFLISNNAYTRKFVNELAMVQDKNGNEYSVEGYVVAGDYIRVNLSDGAILKREKNGSITELLYYDNERRRLPKGMVSDYRAQYGLQGVILSKVAITNLSYLKLKKIGNGVCAILIAIVLVAISYFVALKYNLWLGGTFYVTFCTSPWIVNFAPNLYWVGFTWFIPMLISLAVTMTDMSIRYRCLAYFGALIAVTVKCLCGYEYVSTILIGMIMFPVVDCFVYWHRGDRLKAKKYMKLIVGLGVAGVAGFFIALAMHGYVRGDGNIGTGLYDIFQHDVLRRTWGNPSNFNERFTASLTASALTVFAKYLFFTTKVVIGIPGWLFVPFALTPVIVRWYCRGKNWKLPWGCEVWALYVMGFISAVSWLVLAKGHSYIHTHMNYVLWYFGFVQICLYCLVVFIRDRIVAVLIEKNIIGSDWRERLVR